MRTWILNVVLLVALAAAGSRLWLFLSEPPPSLPAATAGATQPVAAAPEPEPNAETADVRSEAYDVIVARDLFSATRGVVPPEPTAATRPAPKPQPPPKLTLSGVVIVEGEKIAYLQEGNQESRPRKVKENESFANGVVKTIRPDGVTFLFAGTEINVPLRTPKDGTGATSPGRPETITPAPRSQVPVAFPRRQPSSVVPQGQIPTPGRSAPARPALPVVVPPAESGGEDFGVEEFPDESMPGGEVPGMTEEEVGE